MKYLKYLLYVLEHKKNVAIECLKKGMFIHAITHDLSKFKPSEFIPYANYFYGRRCSRGVHHLKDLKFFNKAWNAHQKSNKHHWNYWVLVSDGRSTAIEMPDKYVKQMIVDWKAMSRKFGDTPKEYYQKNKNGMILHRSTKAKIRALL